MVSDVLNRPLFNSVDDFDIKNLANIYAKGNQDFLKNPNEFEEALSTFDDLEIFAGESAENFDYESLDNRYSILLNFSREYVSHNNSEKDEWISGLRFWVPKLSQYFLRKISKSGKQFATYSISSQSLTNWFKTFSDPDETLVGHDFIALPIAMFHNINVRDAMLMCILDENRKWYNEESLHDLAWMTHTPDISRNLRNCLEEKFTQECTVPNICKALDAKHMLESMAYVVKDIPELTVQVYALLSYICWWFSIGEVDAYVNKALAIDPDCSMAKIVRGAHEHNIQPAWCSKFATPRKESWE